MSPALPVTCRYKSVELVLDDGSNQTHLGKVLLDEYGRAVVEFKLQIHITM